MNEAIYAYNMVNTEPSLIYILDVFNILVQFELSEIPFELNCRIATKESISAYNMVNIESSPVSSIRSIQHILVKSITVWNTIWT
jgi:hypothetical protein